jgi:hypothetical protein
MIMNRDKILNELTLIETAEYRKRGFELNGKYSHEPKQFRTTIYAIFEKLSDDDLMKLHNFKTNNMTEQQLEEIVEKHHYGYGEYDGSGIIEDVLELYNKEKQQTPRQITEKELKIAAKECNVQSGLIEYVINRVRENQKNNNNGSK